MDQFIFAEYSETLLTALEGLIAPVEIGLCATLILLAKSQSIVPPHLAFTLALKIDSNNQDKLLPQIKRMLLELPRYLPNQSVTPNEWHIATLADAIALIERHPGLGIPTHVATTFAAIDRACQWTDAELERHEGQLIRIPTGTNESEYYFHAESHLGREAKRNALNNLQLSIIAAWNNSILRANGLVNFLNSVQNSLCIEGATREALTQATLSHTDEKATQTFLGAMCGYHDQALALVTAFGFTPTIDNLKQAILNAYNGESCLEDRNNPQYITEATVEKYLQDLDIYDYDKDQSVTQAPPLGQTLRNFSSLMAHYCILNAIKPYCCGSQQLEFYGFRSMYTHLLCLAQPGASINVSEYVKMVIATDTLHTQLRNQPLF